MLRRKCLYAMMGGDGGILVTRKGIGTVNKEYMKTKGQ